MWALFEWRGSGGRVLSLSGGGRRGAARRLLVLMVGCLSADHCVMTEGIILKVEALGWAQKQPAMHDGPIVTWHNGDPIAPVPASDVGADAVEDGSVAPEQPLFFPVDFHDTMDNDVATISPLRVVLVDVGADNVQGAADQEALAADQGLANVQGAADQ